MHADVGEARPSGSQLHNERVNYVLVAHTRAPGEAEAYPKQRLVRDSQEYR